MGPDHFYVVGEADFKRRKPLILEAENFNFIFVKRSLSVNEEVADLFLSLKPVERVEVEIVDKEGVSAINFEKNKSI